MKMIKRAPIGPIPEGEDFQPPLDGKWPGAKGLAEDVRRYGHWMREEAKKRIGHLYPQVEMRGQAPRRLLETDAKRGGLLGGLPFAEGAGVRSKCDRIRRFQRRMGIKVGSSGSCV